MIVTVTANTGIDQTLFIQRFEPKRTMRALDSAIGMGGKGTDVSWNLGTWGVPSLALGFAAGGIGRQMQQMLQERGVDTNFTWCDGSTRWNTIIVCEDGSCSSTITTSTLEVLPQHLADFELRFQKALSQASCLCLCGTTPRGVPLNFYPRLIRQAQAAGVPVLLDSSGSFLKAGLEARPWLIKPNLHELEELCGEKVDGPSGVVALAHRLQQVYPVNLIVTMGIEGAYAFIEGRAWWIPPIPVEVISAAGAGDAVIAGMALAVAQRQSHEEGLRLGFAMATAMLLTPATGDFRPEDVRRFLSQVQVLPL